MAGFEKQELVNSLPFLRRYARAVAGSQQSADTLVLSVVQSLSRAGTEANHSARVMLYQRFADLWNGPEGQRVRELSANHPIATNVDRKLAALPSLSRQAFLLYAVEGFHDTDIAEILRVSLTELKTLSAQARREISQQLTTDVLIIEDELFIATDLEDIVTSLGHTVISVERTHAEAVNTLNVKLPGLVLADVQLADGSSGLNAVNEILSHCEVPVIFITAFPERLLTGLRPEPAFVLTKPFKPEMVAAVVSQALFFDTRASSSSKPGARECLPRIEVTPV